MFRNHRNRTEPKTRSRQLFGEALVGKGLITQEQLSAALVDQRAHGGFLGEALHRLNVLEEELVTRELASYLSMEYYDLSDASEIDPHVAKLLTENISKRFCLIGVREEGEGILVAMADPLNIIEIDTIKLKTGRDVKVVISSPGKIRQAIEEIFHGSSVQEENLRSLVETEEDEEEAIEEDLSDLESGSEEAAAKAPVIRFVDLLLNHAVKSRASDIHIEPQEKSMKIRMRIDGVLRDAVPPPRKMQAAVITRAKILAGMDIAERRLPQDGRFQMKSSGHDIDIRVSSLPTIYGEKIVMRILDAAAVDHNIDKLGLEEQLLKQFKKILAQPHGIVVVTGPTGSGKSTTLYSVLNYLRDPGKNITTVEDPVEYRLGGINQIQVRPEIHLDFAACLRSILRQDPDIVLIGEIRDKETMDIAIKASLTGHLVLSTFHTNDAPSAISRFTQMGLEPYLLASTLNIVIAQRLVRRICEHCKEPIELSQEILNSLRISPEVASQSTFYQGKGCKFCTGTGYHGRMPVFEFLVVDNEIKDMVTQGAHETEIRSRIREKGYGGLVDSGISRMVDGVTTAEEVLRVTFMEDIRVD